MYACTGRYRISMAVTGMAIVRGERDARQLAKLRDRRCHQVAPNSSTSRPGPPSGFLIVVRLIILLVFSRFFDILLSAFRTRQPGRPTLGFWSSFLSQHTSALGV